MDLTNRERLRDALTAAVPLLVAEYETRGGPQDVDWQWAREEFPYLLGEFGAHLLYPVPEKPWQGRERGTAARIFSAAVRALAIASFCPGGIRFMDLHFRAQRPGHWPDLRRCRVCGCSDNDYSGCVQQTGQPCWWAETDLCSACQTEPGRTDEA